MGQAELTVALALTGALFIGFSDFLGGLASRTYDAIAVTVVMTIVAGVLLAPMALILGADHISTRDVALGAASGLATGVAYVGFFAAIGHGRISTVVPVTAAVTALVPAVVGIVGGTGLSSLALVGVACALVAIPLVAYEAEEEDRTGEAEEPDGAWSAGRQVAVAVGCGIGFGLFFVCIGSTDEGSGLWPTVGNLVVGGLVAGGWALARGVLPSLSTASRLAVWSGVALAGADTVNTLALQHGPLTVASVLGNLYPVVTIALGAVVLRERVRAWHAAGIVLAIAGVVLVAAG